MTEQELLAMLKEKTRDTDTVVFDIGNTLMRFDPDGLCDALIAAPHRERLRHALFAPDHTWKWACFDQALYPNEEIALKIVREEGLEDACAAEVLYVLNHFHERMFPLPLSRGIPALKAEGKRLLALTNYAWPQLEYCWQSQAFFSLFDGRVVSSQEKVVKPDARIFRILTERYSVRPEDALFVDDNADNTAAAAALGFRVWQGDFL